MNRSAMPPRSRPLRRRGGRIDQRAVRRRAEGGKRAIGRESLSSAAYAVLQRMIWIRAGGDPHLLGVARCEACGRRTEFIGLEHAVARSQGGKDSWSNCFVRCLSCARWKETAFSSVPRGRLLPVPIPGEPGRFDFIEAHGSKSQWTSSRHWFGGRVPDDEERKVLAALGAVA